MAHLDSKFTGPNATRQSGGSDVGCSGSSHTVKRLILGLREGPISEPHIDPPVSFGTTKTTGRQRFRWYVLVLCGFGGTNMWDESDAAVTRFHGGLLLFLAFGPALVL